MSSDVSRRKFLSNSLAVSAAVPFLALVGASACKSDAPADAPADKPADAPPADAPAADGAVCDASKLSEADQAPRKALGYIEKSTTPDKNCANCNLYKEDIGGCAGCTLFKGPVAAEGYCNSWVAKA